MVHASCEEQEVVDAGGCYHRHPIADSQREPDRGESERLRPESDSERMRRSELARVREMKL